MGSRTPATDEAAIPACSTRSGGVEPRPTVVTSSIEICQRQPSLQDIQHGYDTSSPLQKGFAAKRRWASSRSPIWKSASSTRTSPPLPGHYHLARNAAGGGDAQGIFSLFLRDRGKNCGKDRAAVKIFLDHTS